jgi:hypothetical protein
MRMAFREVSVSEIREVLRLWLGVAGLPAPGYRTIAAHCGVDRKTVRYADVGITHVMPTSPLCRADDFCSWSVPNSSRRCRHNVHGHRLVRKASRASGGW